MDAFNKLMEASLEELAIWGASHPDDKAFCEALQPKLALLASMTSMLDRCKQAHVLRRIIADQGPLSGEFMPSFWSLSEGLSRWQKQQGLSNTDLWSLE